MISIFGTTLGSTAPWILIGIPLVSALLVYVYRNLGTSKNSIVSTLFLLRDLPLRPTSRKKFTPPLQFWIELFALLLLILAASGIFLSDAGKKVAVVIDLSLSMQAPGSDGAKRIDSAKRLAIADMTQSLPTTRFYPFAAHIQLKPLSSGAVSAIRAASLLNPLETLPTEDHLQKHLTSLVNSGDYDSVWVYTDRSLAGGAPAPTVRVVSVTGDPNTRALTNLWIRALSPKGVDGKTFLSTAIEQVGLSSVPVSVIASCYNLHNPSALKPRILPEQTLQLPSGVVTTTLLGPVDPPWTHCQVRVTSSSATASDLLTEDNEAWVTSDSITSGVTIVSPLTPAELAIEQLGGITITAAQRSDDAAASRGSVDKINSPTIIHRSELPATLSSSALVVYPPAGKLPWGGAVRDSNERAIQISRWNTSHPVMRYINPTLLSLKTTRIIECPPSATALLTTTAGTVACAGERDGVRYAVVGFELFPFDGAKTPTLSILTLNLFKWLFETQSAAQRVTPYETIQLARGVTEVRYVAPTSKALAISANGSVTPDDLGVLMLSESSSGKDYLKAINLLSDQESNLTENTPLSLGTGEQSAADSSSKESFDAMPLLTSLALLVLVLDLIRRIAYACRWSRP